MHEHHLAQDVIAAVERLMRENGWQEVNRVLVRVQRPSAVVHESLRQDFDLLKKDSLLPGAKLDIEEEPLAIHCKECGVRFNSINMVESCPECGSSSLRMEWTGGISLGRIEHEP